MNEEAKLKLAAIISDLRGAMQSLSVFAAYHVPSDSKEAAIMQKQLDALYRATEPLYQACWPGESTGRKE